MWVLYVLSNKKLILMFSIWINDNIGTNDLMSGLGMNDS